MSLLIQACLAIALYLGASLYLWFQLRRQPKLNQGPFLGMAALAIIIHGMLSFQWVVTPDGLDFGLLPMSSALFFAINLVVLLSSLQKPLHNLFLGLFPITLIILLVSLFTERSSELAVAISHGISLHIIFSILAYSLLTIASFHAVLLAWQNWHLHNRQSGGWLQTHMPPLQTMEALLFELLWCGFFLLTLSLVTGLFFIDDFFAQQLAHKTFFSIAAWFFYAVLLWGHHVRGWRGNLAIRWTLGGFIALALSYTGSKFVLEVLLG